MSKKYTPIDFDDENNDFTRLANQTIEKAETIDCSLDDFIEGLRLMASMLEDRADNAPDGRFYG